MNALPTIDKILAGLAEGRHTPEQARVWIDLHVGNAIDAAADTDDFAARAMQSLLCDRIFVQDAKNRNCDLHEAVAEAAYRQASAMKTARML
jgi:hypothetical protein